MSVILLDLDGVLADFVLGFRRLAAEMFPPQEVWGTAEEAEWNGIYRGLTSEQADSVWGHIKEYGPFWVKLDPLFDWKEWSALRCLEVGHTVYYGTSRPGPYTYWWTRRWLNNEFLDGSLVVLAPGDTARRKAELARVVGADYALDDHPGYAQAMAQTGTQAFVRAWPYNEPEKWLGTARRVSLLEFCRIVEEGR